VTGRETLAAILGPLLPVIIGTLIAGFLALRKWFKRLDTKQEIEQLKAQLLAKQQEFDAQQLVIETIKSKLGVAK
jgi:uncharacterized membrane-anchored protein YhcB (DUF1043 family)